MTCSRCTELEAELDSITKDKDWRYYERKALELDGERMEQTERVSQLEAAIEQIRRYADNEQVEMVCKDILASKREPLADASMPELEKVFFPESAQDPNVCEHGVNTLMAGLCNQCSKESTQATCSCTVEGVNGPPGEYEIKCPHGKEWTFVSTATQVSHRPQCQNNGVMGFKCVSGCKVTSNVTSEGDK